MLSEIGGLPIPLLPYELLCLLKASSGLTEPLLCALELVSRALELVPLALESVLGTLESVSRTLKLVPRALESVLRARAIQL